jgi:hypothetical protein
MCERCRRYVYHDGGDFKTIASGLFKLADRWSAALLEKLRREARHQGGAFPPGCLIDNSAVAPFGITTACMSTEQEQAMEHGACMERSNHYSQVRGGAR